MAGEVKDWKKDSKGRFGKGNPGRPKGTGLREFREALARLEQGQGRDVLADRLLELAMSGDMQAMKLCLNYKFGTPSQSIDMNHRINTRAEDMTDAELEAIASGED